MTRGASVPPGGRRTARRATRHRKRRLWATITGCAATGCSGLYLLGDHLATGWPHHQAATWVAVGAGLVGLLASAAVAVDKLIRVRQRWDAGKILIRTTETHDQALQTWGAITGSGAAPDQSEDEDGDEGDPAGSGS